MLPEPAAESQWSQITHILAGKLLTQHITDLVRWKSLHQLVLDSGPWSRTGASCPADVVVRSLDLRLRRSQV